MLKQSDTIAKRYVDARRECLRECPATELRGEHAGYISAARSEECRNDSR